MKGKYFFGALLMALLGAVIALVAYTKIVDKPEAVVARDSSKIETPEAKAYLTALQMQPGQVDFTYAAEQTVHAVVHVRTKSTVQQPQNPIIEWFYGDRYSSRPREVAGYGSGVIISADGYIITNNHVIEDAENIEVKLNDNRLLNAEVIGRDPTTDIALLKVKAQDLSYLKYGDSDNLKVGEWVLAVGNPFNLTSTVTAGIVSAKGRNLGILENDYRIESFIQTDAALNMGNSGGALVDTKGLLVGITSAIYSPSGAYAGNSFAIPVSIVKKVVEDLKEYGEVQRALIGVNIADVTPEIAEDKNLKEIKGAIITDVKEGGSAADANLKKDDVIIKFNGVTVNNATELQEQVGKQRPGDRVNITYIRNGKESTVPITLKNISGTTAVVERGSGGGAVFGARFEPLSSNDKRMFGVDNGVKIVEVGDGLFRDLGIRRGTIITTINNKKVNSGDDVRSAAGSTEKSLRSIAGITPEGRQFQYQYGN
ncbi:MAG TPA: Do family serine endopeptidase [Bacteroidales bacterium]|jgi:Do/DeqQ family serine protease|nr:Do family serine endopeptidase [Bacteroidales bacterium]HOX73731.1 Do family serine endopeptidase [Bacteroidales bacterium]HPM88056.1 Do family serine endopeptidase [Bacteroidales bacterium]HQM69331.1 Do family serine endopeptidase [Bacteroidales bacterium]